MAFLQYLQWFHPAEEEMDMSELQKAKTKEKKSLIYFKIFSETFISKKTPEN